MMSELAKVLFEELADEPIASRRERLAVLSESEAADVRGLLEVLDQSPGFLDLEGVVWREETARSAVPLGPGSRVRSFTIVREVGRGGMGVVYEAMQDSPRRRVALKLMQPGKRSRGDLTRFHREAEALGRLNHAGIASVYEARMLEGDRTGGEEIPYIAMEFVDGSPITEHAAALGLDVAARVRLMVAACRAVHHAHSVGVVHRDISPSNVMVNSEGQVKIVDFGVARLSEAEAAASLVTAGDRVLGKWGYVSPEQAAGSACEIDHRADVFSLGAVLYELVSGRRWRVTDGRTIFELIRAIERDEPTRWRSLGCAREDDLWAVVETSLQKQRGRRYPSAEELADELERWLRGRAVIARPMGRLERGRRFIADHRTLSTATAVVILALTTATAISSLMAFRARSAENQLSAGLGAVMEGILEPLANQRSTMDAREATLKSIEPGIEQIRRARPGDRRVQTAVARYEFEWGKLLGFPYSPNLSRRSEAVARFRAGLALISASGMAAIDDEDVALLAVKAASMLGSTLIVDGLASEVEAEARDAVRACDRWIGRSAISDEWLNTRSEITWILAQAVADLAGRDDAVAIVRASERVVRNHEPVNPSDEQAFQYGSAWIGIGMAYSRLSMHRECIESMEESRRFLDRFVEPGRTDDDRLINTSDPHRYIARSLSALGDYVGAERVCSHSLSLVERIRAAYPERPDPYLGFATIHVDRAAARAALGKLSAVDDARAAVRYRRLRLEEDPNAPMGLVALAQTLNELCKVSFALIRDGCVPEPEGKALAALASASLDEAERLLDDVPVSPLQAKTWCELQTSRVGIERAMMSK